jgi:hypothetical protein
VGGCSPGGFSARRICFSQESKPEGSLFGCDTLRLPLVPSVKWNVFRWRLALCDIEGKRGE